MAKNLRYCFALICCAMVALKGNVAMASLYDKAVQQWNNIFSTASAAEELAAIGTSTQRAINDTVRKIDRDAKIQQGVAEALNFQKSPSYVRPKARPASLTKEISSFSAPPATAKGSALDGNWASYVPKDLIFTESSNKWDADTTDKKGRRFVGALQFGQSRLNDLIKNGVLPKGTTLEMLKNNTDAQVKAGNWHFQDYINRINKNGLSKYIGSKLPGQDKPLTMNSLLAMAHLGGFSGMTKSLTSGGKHNPKDSLGTSLVKYAQLHSN